MITISVDGENRTSYIDWTSLRIENVLTNQVDRCTFKILSYEGKSFRPIIGNEVIVSDGSNRLFGGLIVRATNKSDAVGMISWEVECTDYTRLLDQHLVAETYEGMTVGDIIDDIVLNWLPAGFTTVQVDCDVILDYIQFKYEQPSACLKQLADLTGYDYYVDYYKDIYFKSPTSTPAPFTIEDNSGTYENSSLVIRSDNSQMRNSILVRGGEYEGSKFTASQRADGKQVTFNLPYKYHEFAATLTGHRLSIGVDYLDDPNSYDALYNFNEKLLRFKEADRPNQNATLSFSGKPLLPVVVRVSDSVAIAETLAQEGQGDGIYEYLVVDKSINTQVAARERAAAEIQIYGETLSEGDFSTETSGLRAGQRVTINSDLRNVHEDYIINRVTSHMKTPDMMIYDISLITTKSLDYITVMKNLLTKDNKSIVITDDELLNLTESYSESILFTATTTVQAVNYAVEWVLGDSSYTPTGFKRVFTVGGGRLS